MTTTAPTADDRALLGSLRLETERLAAVPADHLALPVPTCPGWTLGELVGHVGRVHRWATALSKDPRSTTRWRDIVAPAGGEVLGWYSEGVGELLEAFERFDTSDLAVDVRTWAGDRPRRWWLRRLAHETTVHRWDADNALGAVRPVQPVLAVDAIDEVFQVFVPARFDLPQFGPHGETWHLHTTDTTGEWLLRFTADGVEVRAEHAKGDCATRGRAEDLLLLLWGRIALSGTGIEAFGDTTIVERWRTACRF